MNDMAYDHGAFRVSNLENSIKFYTEKLGFTFLFQNENPAHHEKYAFLENHGARLELIETTDAVYHPIKPEAPYCPHLCFETDDIDGVITTLKENGIELLDGPNEIPGSEMWLYFTDLDENVLEYITWFNK